uniref:B-cell lymphoma 9 beta-catenin binding domain-containing protein n=1 Tax=Timema douglasi TaxID=61478 RepID=A0A7R8Z9C4_TIMDO|nr:unnamed protein product [Timema douglasi]
MIKDEKDRNEKPGSDAGSKGDVAVTVPPSQSCDAIPEEESGTESHGTVNVNGVEEGEVVKKNGATNTNTMSSCVHEPLLGSSNVGGGGGGPVSMGSIHTPSSATGAGSGPGDLCLLETAQEVSKPDESNTQDKPPSCGSMKGDVNGSNNTSHEFTPGFNPDMHPGSPCTAGRRKGAGKMSQGSNTPAERGKGQEGDTYCTQTTERKGTRDPCEGALPINMPMSSTTGPPPNGVQPLPSNVINKQPGTMEAQYMQQQSQIFVFSTNLANKSAEAVLQGHFPSIIAYHCAQPGTKKYLEKHPLKMNQFSRQNPAQWLNSLAQMKQKVGPNLMKSLNTMGLPVSNEMGLNPNTTGGMGMWNQARIGKVELEEVNPHLRGGKVESHLGKTTPVHPTKIRTSISLSSAVELQHDKRVRQLRHRGGGNWLMSRRSIVSGRRCVQTCVGKGRKNFGWSVLETLVAVGQKDVLATQVAVEHEVPSVKLFSEGSENMKCGGAQAVERLVAANCTSAEERRKGRTSTNTMSNMGPTSNQMMQPQPCASNILPGCPVSNPLMHGGPMRVPSGGMDSPCMMSGSPNPNTMLSGGGGHHSPNIAQTNPGGMLTDMVGSPSMNLQPSLTGVKVPDENLTPQQRQHREEQLATIRKMQQMLFPEHQSSLPEGGTMCQQPEMLMHSMGPMMNMNPALGPNGGMMNQKNLVMGGMGGPNPITPTSVAAQIEWQKLQHQFYEDRKKKGPSSVGMVGSSCSQSLGSPAGSSVVAAGQPMGMGPRGSGCMGPRTQGPPPPYHQTTRSASVPTAMPSPSPSSPNNPTSNLSLPSPRATSALNSPADPNRPPFGSTSGRLVGPGPSPTGMHCTSLDSPNASRPINSSNPGTPLSTHLSPSSTRKEGGQGGSDFSTLSQSLSVPLPTQQPPVDGMFCRTLQSLAQQKQQQQPNQGVKEPNLMPVPSPQQIQYLNTFEGQELTIQKQPNTSLKETGVRSPSLPPLSMDSNLPTATSDVPSSNRISGPGTPLTPNSLDVGPRFSSTSGESNRFPVPSPHTPTATQNDAKTQQQPPQQPPPQQHRYSGPSPQNQGPCTPGLESTNKPPTTEVVQRFHSSSPQTDGMGPPRVPNSGNGPNSTSPVINNQTQNFMQQTNPSMTGMKVPPQFLDISPSGNSVPPVDGSPTGSGSFPCVRSENVPLNPNTGGIICNGKTSHFDPITSMAQMSQQLANSVANSPNGQNPALMSGLGVGPGVLGMMPYNPGVHHMQMNEMGNCPGLNDPQVGPSTFGGMPLQNAAPHSYSPNSSVGVMVSQCTGGVNTTPSMNQPIVHTNSSASPKPNNMMMSMVPSRGLSPYSASPVPQRMMGRQTGPNLYSGANVQVKASAPNTINYLPTKPQSGGNPCPRNPPSLDFLRFANPLSNLDSKVPTHNLQYFPNNGQPNVSGMGNMNMPMNRSNGVVVGMSPQMGGMPGPNCGPVTNSLGGHIGNMNGPMMGPNGPMVGMGMPMPGGMAMGPNQGPGMAPMRGGPGMPQMRPGMMRMQQMGGPMYGVPPNPGQQVGDQIFGPGPGNTPNSQMFVPGSKSSPLSLGGAPDASQPLPPSMGQSNTFKNSTFIGPTTADPNYAQQFHNFQQQLYATNTRNYMSMLRGRRYEAFKDAIGSTVDEDCLFDEITALQNFLAEDKIPEWNESKIPIQTRQRWNRSKVALLLVYVTDSTVTGPETPRSFMLRRFLEQS